MIAPDSFKGTLTAAEVAAALAAGFEAEGWVVDACPLADGGEGTAAVLMEALGGREVVTAAHGPLGDPVEGSFALLDDCETAVVEVASASGLALLAEAELDPIAASSAGTGELIAAAAHRAAAVLVAVGGSATTDGGEGAIAAIEAAGGLGGARLVCLCDVGTPWERAAEVFAPQKGAGPDQVAALADRLDRLAAELPRDPRGVPLTGAAGGLAGGLWARYGAELVPGAAYVCDAAGLDRRIAAAGLAVTGEGRLDATTLEGKVVAEVARRAGRAGIPCHAVVGSDESGESIRAELGLASVAKATGPAELAAAARAIALASRS